MPAVSLAGWRFGTQRPRFFSVDYRPTEAHSRDLRTGHLRFLSGDHSTPIASIAADLSAGGKAASIARQERKETQLRMSRAEWLNNKSYFRLMKEERKLHTTEKQQEKSGVSQVTSRSVGQ